MKKLLFALVLLLTCWIIWANTGIDTSSISTDAKVDLIQSFETDSLSGRNIIGIQPYMTPTDYLSQTLFERKLSGYFIEAQKQGFLNDNTLVLLPEYLGTWLAIVDEKNSLAEVPTINAAMTRLVLSHPIQFIKNLFYLSGESDPFAATLFRMKSEKMVAAYQKTFKSLSEKYQVSIVAGSIVLPSASVSNDCIIIDSSLPLYNTTFIFTAKGQVLENPVKKVFPISAEQGFTQSNTVNNLPVFNTSVGRTAVLICADSWYPETYVALENENPEIMLIPSYSAGNGIMSKLWGGYDGGQIPTDVNQEDIGNITEREAWNKYALTGRFSKSSYIGMNMFLRGELWDLGTDGSPSILTRDSIYNVTYTDSAAIWNLNF